jgi:preprotein translocase subunit SecA
MFKKFIRIIGGDPEQRELNMTAEIAGQINGMEAEFELLSDSALRDKTDEFRSRIEEYTLGIEDSAQLQQAQQEILDEILPEAFATVREASKRTLGLRHYDVQLIGGVILHKGKIAEMRTGEGKTLVATLPLYLNALTGRGTHLVTVNDYLARRDARWMAPIYHLLGLSVGVLQMAARTENGKKAFLVDLERESPHEDQHQLRMVPRSQAYAADITYGTNSEFGFDYLRDNMTMRLEDRVQHGHHYAIIDEVDNVLIDEARTPLIISGPAQEDEENYIRMAQVVRQLRPEDYEVSEKDRNVTLTEVGEGHVEEILGMPLRDPDRPEDLTLEQARILGHLEQALRAHHLYRRNKEYLVQGGKVVIVDEFTGRLMPGRRWSDGLHQAVEAKEGVKVQSESVTYATITIQNYFRMYDKLAGMTGTAVTEAEEFSKIYDLEVLAIPTNLEYEASRQDSGLVQLDARDESGYKYTYYARDDDQNKEPVYWKRKDYPDVVYRTEEAKLRAIAGEILHDHSLGRPVLVGTTSVEMSDRLSNRMKADPLRKLTQVMLLRDAWMVQNNREMDGRAIPELQFLNEPLEGLSTSDMRKLARELNLSFNPTSDENLNRLLGILELPASVGDRLSQSLQAGIPLEVLNARRHTEESQIIAGAGAYGAVTIATNMAGRGVDIKLGGEMVEEIISAVNRILNRLGYEDPYNMSMDERRQILEQTDSKEFGIYESEINYFLRQMKEMELVRELGGLHVIGSERHEARRIDNQLRGRSARQGDPGSSRFYLSMEDELMRLFGGQQADALMQRLNIDDSLPLEMGLVGRIVEQSQTRVEGANFDVRKHLLEYDDVLNTQRAKIYNQRDRIMTKDDLTQDVTDMLRSEVNRRVPLALEDEGGPWKLIGWLEQIQPPLRVEETFYPTYALRLLIDQVLERVPSQPHEEDIRTALVEVTEQALRAETEHQINSVNTLIENTGTSLDELIDERLETLDAFFDVLTLEDETGRPRRPEEIIDDLSGAVRIPLRISSEAQRALRDDPDLLAEEARQEIEDTLSERMIIRLIGAIERRMDADLGLSASDLASMEWSDMADQIQDVVEEHFDDLRQRYLGEGGSIVRDIDRALSRLPHPLDTSAGLQNNIIELLLLIPQGTRIGFDKKTHRRKTFRTQRLNFIYLVAQVLEGREPEAITDHVLTHLEGAQQAARRAWGLSEWVRLQDKTFADLDKDTRRGLESVLEERYNPREPLTNLPKDQQELAVDELGRRTLTGLYRQLLLSVISELWVEYLTQMEALRVSIGLEAYAQRDPLVQYKNKAFELFQGLFDDMRTGLVTRMFTYRPRDLSSVQATVSRTSAEPSDGRETVSPTESTSPVVQRQSEAPTPQKSSKRKRRRRRR